MSRPLRAEGLGDLAPTGPVNKPLTGTGFGYAPIARADGILYQIDIAARKIEWGLSLLVSER